MLYVDDLVIIGNLEKKITSLKVKLARQFKLTDLGQLGWYLGINFTFIKEEYSCLKNLTLRTCFLCLVVHCNSTKVPMVEGTRLIVDMNERKVDATTYKKMVGKLIYLVNTKLDFRIWLSVMNQLLAEPQQPHLNVVKQILRYLKGTIDCGILYKRGHNVNLEAFVDFD